jgi:two-component system CheB/CheR fusion protein
MATRKKPVKKKAVRSTDRKKPKGSKAGQKPSAKKKKRKGAAHSTAATAKATRTKAAKPINKKSQLPRKAKAEPTESKPLERGVPIVGIGASAGGLQAFEEFFRAMPADSGMAFVLVSHLDPDHVSILHELLSKSAHMPVEQITDGLAVMANRVYVIPPGKDLAVMNGVLHLMDAAEPHGFRLPIDYFFRSLAQDQEERAIGIILSGNGSDGTLGIKAIKGGSGLVMAQDPDSAKFTGMPASAIATGMVDFIFPAGDMPRELMKYAGGPYLKTAEPELAATPLPAMMQKIFLLLRSRTGHDFSFYKSSTLRRRIARRMNIHQIQNYKHYIRYLEDNPQEVDLLFKELLIGVTSFFRDADAFDALARGGLPQLLKDRPDNMPLRVWVPGCSTGEEAYSLSILLRETINQLKKPCEIQIFATDLDAKAIETARTGQYPDGIASDVTASRLQRFFTKENGYYRIRKDIRETVVFAQQNLIKDPPFTRLDLVSCRNLLIYLQSEMQKRLLPLFHYAVKPGGLLFLGTSESVSGFAHLFQAVDKKWKIFKRKEGPASMIETPAGLPALSESQAGGQVEAEPRATVPVRPNIIELSSRLLSERYAPPSVIVNEQGDVVYFHGETGLYLQPAPGQPSHNIHHMARKGLRLELAAAIRKAIGQDEEVVHKGVEVKANGDYVRVDLKVGRIVEPESLRGLLLVTFEAAAEPRPVVVKKRTPSRAKTPKGREAAIEHELQLTKANLQSTIEELQTSNEELKSTNEELQSTNEELQSTNEELETSKEEMQSLNEELQTVNAELQGKVEQLSRTNDDMTNLLNATDIATIFLSNDLKIKRFTNQATSVFRLIPSDVGRPITDIVSRLKYQELERDARQVAKTLSFQDKEVQSETGEWFALRILPYRTSENVIDGLVITFVCIDRVKNAELKSKEAMGQLAESMRCIQAEREFSESIVATVREPLVVLDTELRVVSANASFYRTFQVEPDETRDKRLCDLGEGQWDIPKLCELLEDILPSSSSFDGFEVEHTFPGIGRRRILLNARRLERQTGSPSLILLAMEDVTDRPKEKS